jgi:hypothetical protein
MASNKNDNDNKSKKLQYSNNNNNNTNNQQPTTNNIIIIIIRPGSKKIITSEIFPAIETDGNRRKSREDDITIFMLVFCVLQHKATQQKSVPAKILGKNCQFFPNFLAGLLSRIAALRHSLSLCFVTQGDTTKERAGQKIGEKLAIFPQYFGRHALTNCRLASLSVTVSMFL